MQSPDAIRLRHMLEAANEAIEYARPLAREDLAKDRKTARAIVGSLLVVGEAASRVSDSFRAAHPAIAWTDIVGMRNRLIHAYHDINLDIVWQTIHDDLPPLVAALQRALDEMT